MFPDKESMAKRAKSLWAFLVAAPVLYLAVAATVVSTSFGPYGVELQTVQLLFVGLLVVSATNFSFNVFTQTSPRFLHRLAMSDPVGRVFQVFAIGSILSETLAIYGLVLTLVSGSLIYVIGFSFASWASLVWIRTRFRRNLGNLS